MKRFVNLILIGLAVFAFGLGIYKFKANSELPDIIRVTDVKPITTYIKGGPGGFIKLSDGSIGFCLDIDKKIPKDMDLLKAEKLDGGYAYILESGYPHRGITGDNSKDYFITQAAIWWYKDIVEGTSLLSNGFKNNFEDEHNLRPYIKTLVNNALNHRNNNEAEAIIDLNNLEFIYDEHTDTFISEDIEIKGLNVSDITISIKGLNSGEYSILKKNSNNHFENEEKFAIKIKGTAFAKDIKIKVLGNHKEYIAYSYKPSSNEYQYVMPFLGKYYTSKISKEINVKLPERTPKTGALKVAKKDAKTKKNLAGAHLELYDSSNKLVKSFVTKKEPTIIKNLSYQTYYLKEKEAPKGYQLSYDILEVTINKPEIITVDFLNHLKENDLGKLKVLKVSEKTGKPLKGAILRLKDEIGNNIVTWTSSLQTKEFKDLEAGIYYIEELDAPAGYELLTKKIKVEIFKDSTTSITVKNNLETIPKAPRDKFKININKLDVETERYLSGATLVLKDRNNRKLSEWISSNQSYVVYLKPGIYYVEEIKAPNGYKKLFKPYKFEVIDGVDNQEINVYNSKAYSVPNTGINRNISLYIIGLGFLISGALLIRKYE